jgi:hypothetical protein
MSDAASIPQALARRLEQATPGVDWRGDGGAAEPGALADAGLAALGDAIKAGDDPACAFVLLAADAMITAACTAIADGPLPAALGPDRFVALLEDA